MYRTEQQNATDKRTSLVGTFLSEAVRAERAIDLAALDYSAVKKQEECVLFCCFTCVFKAGSFT